ncbi:amino_oxidase domain-containing protein, partial [Haematococcus lacustris]
MEAWPAVASSDQQRLASSSCFRSPCAASCGSTGLSEAEQTELQSLVTNLDQMAASLGAVPWRQWSEQHPQAREWDQLSVTQWLDRHAVLSGPPESISFLFLLFYIFSSGGMHQLADRSHSTPRLLLTLGNGSQLLASCVVVAVPPPVWHATIQFSPPLSAERQQLGRAMFMGAAMKFVIFYSHAFWREPRLLAPTCKLDACGPVQN